MKQLKYFQYIDTIRRPDGTLRDDGEYEALSFYENNAWLGDAIKNYTKEEESLYMKGLEIKDKEYEKRS
jgi:hypothetical protein